MMLLRSKLSQLLGGIMGLSAIGPVMQIAFAPADFDAAIKHWTETMGVGPFFLMENIALEDMRYRGQPSDFVFSLALAYWGDMQVELVRRENDSPSIYDDRIGDALHHTCVLTDDIEKARTIVIDSGATVLVEAKVGADGHVLYVDTGAGAGSILEILQLANGSDSLFDLIKQASVNWDGSDPLRKLG
jgi:methylmalonyl-CoA/ethylmalonyl-CoA epimerase